MGINIAKFRYNAPRVIDHIYNIVTYTLMNRPAS